MTSKQIRELPLPGIDIKVDGMPVDDAKAAIQVGQASMLREIAAQLAELNENYADFKKTFTSNGAIDINRVYPSA